MSISIGKKFLGGFVIGLGCMAYLSVQNRYVGAFLFSLGLLSVCAHNWHLFTGRLCFNNSLKDLVWTWVINAAGILYAASLYVGAGAPGFERVIQGKIDRGPQIWFCAGFLCEVCIYIAVMGYRRIQSDVGKILSVVLGVMVFILCGFEHCIADIFYAACSNSWMVFPFLAVVTVGNIAGAIVIRWFDGWLYE